jgi:hypothetical protein
MISLILKKIQLQLTLGFYFTLTHKITTYGIGILYILVSRTAVKNVFL